MGTRWTLVFVGLVSGMITARYLGPHDRGILALVTSIPAVIWVLSNFGMNQASVYYINKKIYSEKEIGSACLFIPFAISSFIIFFIFLMSQKIIDRFDGLNMYYLVLSLSMVPFLVIQDSFLGLFRSLSLFDIVNVRQIARSFLGLIAVVFLLIYLELELKDLVKCLFVLEVFIAFWILFEVLRRVGLTLKVKTEIFKELCTFGVKSYIQNIIVFIHHRVDVFMIAFYLTSSDVAIYDISTLVGETLLFLPQSVAFIVMPYFVKFSKEDKVGKSLVVAKYSFYISLILSLILVIFGHYLIYVVYGQEYILSYNSLLLLLPGIVFSSFNGVLTPLFTAENKHHLTIKAGLLSLVLNLVLNKFMIPKFGVNGAAISTSISYSIFSASLIIIYKSLFKVKIADLFLFSKEEFQDIYLKFQREIND